MVVSTGEEGRTRRRTDGSGMKRVVADASPGEPGKRRGADRPAEGVGQAETDIVQQDDDDVRRARRQARCRGEGAVGLVPGAQQRERAVVGPGRRGGAQLQQARRGEVSEPRVTQPGQDVRGHGPDLRWRVINEESVAQQRRGHEACRVGRRDAQEVAHGVQQQSVT